MELFRSEDMHLYYFTCLQDNAWRAINEIGKINSFDFVDLNKGEQVFNLPFGHYLKRWEEVLRSISILNQEWHNMGIQLKGPKNLEDFYRAIGIIKESLKKSHVSFFDEIENKVKEWTKFNLEATQNYHEIVRSYYSLVMSREVLKFASRKYRGFSDKYSRPSKPELDREDGK